MTTNMTINDNSWIDFVFAQMNAAKPHLESKTKSVFTLVRETSMPSEGVNGLRFKV